MGRSYAGILGVVAFTTLVIRAAIAGSSPDSSLLAATLMLFAFAAAGGVLGTIAESTVEQSVRARFEAELKQAESGQEAASPGKA
jgi:hypothetical protein